jgi:hypothetical protein
MTTITKIPFDGVTREGVEKIQTTVTEGRQRAFSFVEGSVRRDSEELVDFYAPSMTAFEIEFENRRKKWLEFKHRISEGAIIGPFFSSVFLSLYVYFVHFLLSDKINPLAVAPMVIVAFVVGLFLALLSICAYWAVGQYFSERKLGFISEFEKVCLEANVETGWGLSDKALHICAPREGLQGVMVIKRIPFADVQASFYSEVDGHEYANIVLQSGETFRIATPEGKNISGARNVVNHLNMVMIGKIAA